MNKPKKNRFNFYSTNLFSDRLSNYAEKECKDWQERWTHSLYWFTYQELRPVSPHTKVKATKQIKSITKPCGSWTLQEQGIHNAEKSYFSSKNTPRNPIKKCLYNHLYTRMNKERKHLKRRCKKPKNNNTIMQFSNDRTSTLDQDAQWTSTLEFFKRTFQENIQKLLSLNENSLTCVQKRDFLVIFHVRCVSLYMENTL